MIFQWRTVTMQFDENIEELVSPEYSAEDERDLDIFLGLLAQSIGLRGRRVKVKQDFSGNYIGALIKDFGFQTENFGYEPPIPEDAID